MFKNTASQSVTLVAFDASTGLPKTGDAANMVFYVAKDDGTVTAISSNSGVPTECDATNAKGDYKIAVSQTETNADKLRFSGKSSTSNIVVVPETIYTLPSAFSIAGGAAGGVFIAGTNAATTVTTSFTTTFTGNLTGSVASVTGAVGSISGVTFPTNFSSLAITAGGIVKADIQTILATAVTEGGAGRLGAAFTKFFDVAVPVLTCASINLTSTVANHIDADISSRMATYTQPTGFLSVTFPAGTLPVATDIVSSGAITTSGGIASADIKKVNAVTVNGVGTSGNPWGP